MHELLSKLESSEPLKRMSTKELEQLATEIRDVLCNLLATRTAHFASNLGVVELCLALHSVFVFECWRSMKVDGVFFGWFVAPAFFGDHMKKRWALLIFDHLQVFSD